jgi:hypothetical protein
MLPGEQLGIVTLTNGKPQGVPEAIDNGFLDVAQHGAPTIDWLSFALKQFKAIEQAAKPDVDYSKRPAGATPPAADGTYIGTYANPHYGPLVVSEQGGKLVMTMGPATGPTTFPLAAYDGDTFSFPTIGENANGLSGAAFTVGPDGKASSVSLEYYDQTGLGTFRRS